MKTFITTTILTLLSFSLSASYVELSLTDVTSGTHFYFCETSVDSVIVYKPEGAGMGDWYHPGWGFLDADSVIIVPSIQGYWEFNYDLMIQFYVYFTDVAPSPWAEDITKCVEDPIILVGQETHQPDFEYMWSTGSTASQISVIDPGIYTVEITGVCGSTNGSVTITNHESPQVNLVEDMLGLCNWDHPTLSPGEFSSYMWSDGSTESTLTITESGIYAITVTDENGCIASDEIEISFYVNPGLEITVVTMDTLTGNNMVTWNTNIPDFQEENVRIYRNGSTNQLTEIGTASYDDGYFIDQVNSTNRTWRYAISVQDECENWSGVSLWHQSMKVSLLEAVGSGIQVSWTQYEVEGNTKDFSVASYEIYSVPGFGINWALNEVASIPGTETTYDIPASLDSLFVVGAVFASSNKSDEESIVSLSFNDNPVINTGVEMLSLSKLSIYPNPSHTGTIVVDAIGELEIYNSLGQKILAKKLKGPDQISLNSGIYMVKFFDQNNATTTKKVIIYG